jgi:predicted Zn-dependent protease with MMP-like domain
MNSSDPGPDLPPWGRLRQLAEQEVQAALRSLPRRLHTQAQSLPVTCQPRPADDLVEDGIAPDTLGLFVGDAWQDAESSLVPLPPQIILFLDNLWECALEDEAEFRREVRKTYLHELGHFLGLDEDELESRGLE